ncbi:MAG TPA: multifunctional CCA tRNA nucleotidyl transferase/2'3'-cyclic phosphodiesterase/2'nucleotidase/phosphatase [Burkholderiales bacterium]|nr:multifunctional CCA tRNA nucleotidyl transferase/2'3'-cyclic phosphodiesterase/2'nucleotidase/phosphatase [Burkholderiales bacterium]
MKTYLVGGAVRDELLGLPVKEKDYVVVGATPEELVAQGYKPVGKDFPVFLHPTTHEEYALARTERKTGRGYKGFTVHAAPDVTLEDDLRRRDLTINAMAKADDGTIIDPFNGRDDLKNRVLRHVSEAFAEDPVRILRVARFAARFGFSVDGKTMDLMRAMVASGEADALVPERVWQEFSKGLAEAHPEKMFAVLEDSGLMAKTFRELRHIPAAFSGSLAVRFAHLAWPLEPKAVEALCARLRAPNEVRELAMLAVKNSESLRKAKTANELLTLLKNSDAFRRPERFGELLEVARLAEKIDSQRFERALQAAAAVNAGEIAKQAARPPEIARLVDEARRRAIEAALKQLP